MKIYILGATGFLGSGAVKYFQKVGHTVLTEKTDIRDYGAIKKSFEESKPDVAINFSGVRARPNIDWCEDHKEETLAVNVGGAINFSVASIESGVYPIQISSGCIYSGGADHPFTEDDPPNFFGSFYSRSRIIMQEVLKEIPVLQVRIRMPISYYPHERNTINKITSYKKVISVPNSVTLIEDMYPALERLTEIKPVGILNLVNEGYIEHSDILSAYKEVVNPEHKYEIISPEELEKSVTRTGRSNCVLSIEKAKSLGLSMPKIDKTRLLEIMKNFK